MTDSERLFWFLQQLFVGHASAQDFLCVRVIHNLKPYPDPQTGRIVENSECLYQRNIPLEEVVTRFHASGGLYEQLRAFNRDPEKPGNIYFGVNSRIHPKINTKTAVRGFGALYLDLDVTSEYSLEDRLA